MAQEPPAEDEADTSPTVVPVVAEEDVDEDTTHTKKEACGLREVAEDAREMTEQVQQLRVEQTQASAEDDEILSMLQDLAVQRGIEVPEEEEAPFIGPLLDEADSAAPEEGSFLMIEPEAVYPPVPFLDDTANTTPPTLTLSASPEVD
jgi:hypothetical protein